jgi:hypothetical protein
MWTPAMGLTGDPEDEPFYPDDSISEKSDHTLEDADCDSDEPSSDLRSDGFTGGRGWDTIGDLWASSSKPPQGLDEQTAGPPEEMEQDGEDKILSSSSSKEGFQPDEVLPVIEAGVRMNLSVSSNEGDDEPLTPVFRDVEWNPQARPQHDPAMVSPLRTIHPPAGIPTDLSSIQEPSDVNPLRVTNA